MKILFHTKIKRLRIEIAVDYQISIGFSWGKAWVNGDEKHYLYIELICFNIRIATLK